MAAMAQHADGVRWLASATASRPVRMNDQFRHKASGAVADVIAWDLYSDRPPTVTLEAVRPQDFAGSRAEFPFDLQRDMPGPDEWGRPTYALPLTIPLDVLEREWEPSGIVRTADVKSDASTGRPPTLAEFLLARIADDAMTARAAAGRNGEDWISESLQDGSRVKGSVTVDSHPRSFGEGELWDDEGALGMWEATAEHVARWDPARVLAECAAKRRIVAAHSGLAPYCGWSRDPNGPHGDDPACDTLCLLALPYSDHPDYREEWKL